MNTNNKITQAEEDYYNGLAQMAEQMAEQIRARGMRDREHGPVLDVIEQLRAQLPPSPKTVAGVKSEVQAAIKQLRRSERGSDALAAFTAFLSANERSALGLDSSNWGALVELVNACDSWGAYNVLPMLPSPAPREAPLLPEDRGYGPCR